MIIRGDSYSFDNRFIKLLYNLMRKNCDGCTGTRQEICNDIFRRGATRVSIVSDTTERMILEGEVESGFDLNANIQKNIIGGAVGDLIVMRCELTNQEIQAGLLEELSKS